MSVEDPRAEPDEFSSEQVLMVREYLRQVLASGAFAGSKRSQDFLQLIVDHVLAGRIDALRERMIGAEMFGRPVDYDTANDAVVRVKASEVRRRLARYYRESGGAPVRIELPVGSYVPKFLWVQGEKSFSAQESILSGSIVPEPIVPESVLPELTANADSQREAAVLKNRTGAVARSRPLIPHLSLRAWILLALGLVLLAVAGLVGFQQLSNRPAKWQIRSIAILPLVNLSGDPNQEYFADGMTEELTAGLGQITSLRVISRTSTMTYKGTKKTLPEIARELHVDGVVEGSISREGNQVRITTQLIDSKTDQHIWARTYNRDMTGVLELQSEVARAITEEIRAELTPQEQARLNRIQLANPEAVEMYLRGTQRLNSGDPKGAIDFFRQSIGKDPNYAAAHSALASAYGWMGEAGWMSYSEAFSQEKLEALKAIELDDSRPEPHLDLASAAMNQSWDWTTQGKEFHRAIELNSNATTVHWAYAAYLNRIGRANDAIKEAKLALQLDPVSSRSYMNCGFVYYFARQYDEALEHMQRSAALHPDPGEILFPLGVIYVEKGLYDLAIQEFQKLGNVPHALGHMGNAYAREGKAAEALAIIPRLKEHIAKTGIGRYEVAIVYAGLKENDNAFEWLEKAFQVRDKGLTYLTVDPCLDPLRSDARFQSLVRRVGLPAH